MCYNKNVCSFRAEKRSLFNQSQFFGFVSIAGPKAGQKHELCVKVSGIRIGTHNLEVFGSIKSDSRRVQR